MKAAVQQRFGPPEVLELLDVPEPVAGAHDVVVGVQACGLNYLDVLQRQGPALLPGFAMPHIAGMDVAGEIVAVGSDVDGPSVGDRVVVNPALHCGRCRLCVRGDDGYCERTRVIGGNHPGGYAQRCLVPASHVYAVPDHVSIEEAATIPTIYSTAWHALVVTARLRVGEWLLIHAAASGVSTAGIQLAKQMGARVIATAGSERKLEFAEAMGADVVVNNRTGDIIAASKEATGGNGVDVVMDHVGPALFQQSLLPLRPRGRMVFLGVTSGTEATFNLAHAYHFGLSLLGSDPYSYREFEEMLNHYWRSDFTPVVDSSFSLGMVGDAQRRMEAGDLMGKIVVTP